MDRPFLVILSAILCFAVIGCSAPTGSAAPGASAPSESPGAPPVSEPSASPPSSASGFEPSAPPASSAVSDPEPSAPPQASSSEAPSSSAPAAQQLAARPEVVLQLDKAAYTVDEIIKATVIITNKGDAVLLYVQGSSSARVPHALDVTAGELTALFYPVFMTDDYGIRQLAPGESVRFDCPFAPYIAKDAKTPVGTDKDIAFFKNNADFEPASGTVTVSAVFTWVDLHKTQAGSVFDEYDAAEKQETSAGQVITITG